MVLYIIISIIVIAFSYWCYKKEHKRKEEVSSDAGGAADNETGTEENVLKDINTTALVINTLHAMNCKPTISEEENDNNACEIKFRFQGATFVIICFEKRAFIEIRFLFWYELSSYNIEKFATMKKVINDANCIFDHSVIYAINKEDDAVYLHSRKKLLFISQIPSTEEYLRGELESFFESYRYVINEIEKSTDKDDV